VRGLVALGDSITLGEGGSVLGVTCLSWAQWLALVCGCLSFAVLFRAARRDVLLVAASAMLGYLITYYAGRQFTPQFGVFLPEVIAAQFAAKVGGGLIWSALLHPLAARAGRRSASTW